MIVYLDVVFFENLIMNLVIILSEAAVLNSLKKFFRKIIASLILSVFYILTLFYPTFSVLQILVGLISIKVAFNPKSIKRLFKETILFYFISFLFGGLSFAMVSFLNKGKVNISNGVLIADFNLFKVFLCGILGVFFVVSFLKKNKKHIFKEIIIVFHKKETKLKVLLDTGNLLKDPYTDSPVIIVEKDAIKTILEEDVSLNFKDIISRKKRYSNPECLLFHIKVLEMIMEYY